MHTYLNRSIPTPVSYVKGTMILLLECLTTLTIVDLLIADSIKMLKWINMSTIHTCLDCLKEPKLTSNTKPDITACLGLGIHGIGFFRQVWKVEPEQDLVARTIKACFMKIPNKEFERDLEAAIFKARFTKNSWI
ncbi:hypothetical protein IGI04_019545 [Brassica rapa subsp. trilocularis]|uniref:Uncharacterized protein n=1 Tax=Brassica rapa subsp. trilocularis TaxID=1813537 RepID=A0ABQ7MJK2_BRACM|nr:hypothetical protein IGI04_019545 [Brassica rapa subsp. trilocularis]